MKSIPMILETPAPEQEIWAEEIKLLYSMVGKEAGDPEILKREKELQELGKEDREKQLDALKRKRRKPNHRDGKRRRMRKLRKVAVRVKIARKSICIRTARISQRENS